MSAYFWMGAGRSEKGGRRTNEDLFFLDGEALPEGGRDERLRRFGLRRRGILGVFDGMGGEKAGDYASEAAAEILGRYRAALLDSRDAAGFRHAAEAYIGEVNQALRKRGEELGAAVGAAMALLCFRGSEALICSLGDCRVYLLRGKSLALLTQDHTLAAFLARRGDLKPEEAASDPRRHSLMRHLGSTQGGQSLQPGYKRLTPEAGDRFLLCSDGISGVLDEDAIRRELQRRSPEKAVEGLLARAGEAGGRDNRTAVCAQVQLRMF